MIRGVHDFNDALVLSGGLLLLIKGRKHAIIMVGPVSPMLLIETSELLLQVGGDVIHDPSDI